MKTVIYCLIFFSAVLSQSTKDFLSVAVVNDDSMLIPVGRFIEDSLINIQNDTTIWENYECDIKEWYYFPFNSNPQKINSGKIIHFINGDDEIEKTYGFDISLKNKTRNIKKPNLISGIASNRLIKIYQKYLIKIVSSKQVIKEIPILIRLSTKMSEQLKNKYPDKKFQNEIKFSISHVDSIPIDDRIYYFYQTIYFLTEPYTYREAIIKQGWILFENNKYKNFDNDPFIVYDEDEYDDEESVIENLGIIFYKDNLYYINTFFIWKSVYYKVEKMF